MTLGGDDRSGGVSCSRRSLPEEETGASEQFFDGEEALVYVATNATAGEVSSCVARPMSAGSPEGFSVVGPIPVPGATTLQ
jgi:hypothetical protein